MGVGGRGYFHYWLSQFTNILPSWSRGNNTRRYKESVVCMFTHIHVCQGRDLQATDVIACHILTMQLGVSGPDAVHPI